MGHCPRQSFQHLQVKSLEVISDPQPGEAIFEGKPSTNSRNSTHLLIPSLAWSPEGSGQPIQFGLMETKFPIMVWLNIPFYKMGLPPLI